MSNAPAVEVKVRVISLNVHYKDPDLGRMSPTPPHDPPRLEIEPNYVTVGFQLAESRYLGDQSGGFTMKTEDAKKLSLMVGDVLTLNVSKDNNEPTAH